MENEKNIDDLFREELGGYTETPPPAVWDGLQRRLANAPDNTRVANKRIWYVVILALLLFVSIPMLKYMSGSRNTGNNTIAGNELNIPTAPASSTANIPVNNVSSNSAISEKGQQTNNNNNTQNHIDNISPNTATSNHTAVSANDMPGHGINPGNMRDESNNATSGKRDIQHNTNKTSATNNIASRGKSGSSNTTTPATRKRASHMPAGKGNGDNEDDGEIVSSAVAPRSYHSSMSEPAPLDDAAQQATGNNVTANSPAPAQKKDDIAGANKNRTSPAGNVNQRTVINKTPRPRFSRLEAGIKGGYETGFDNDASKKVVISPYLQYNFSPRLSVMTQPAFKLSFLNSRRIGNASTYYRENGDSTVWRGSSVLLPIVYGENMYLTRVSYSQSHDSITKTNSFGGTYNEFEIPLLVRYKVAKGLSVYGGPNLVYNRTVAVKENTAAYSHILRRVDTFMVTPNVSQTPYATSTIITYSGSDISGYKGPQYPVTTTDNWRIGYMVGFSYEFYDRWLVDGLIQQASTKANVQGGYNINTAFSAPYIRFTLGYKLIK